jgi:hypothetical protein
MLRLSLLIATTLIGSTCFAQGFPGGALPSPQEIDKRVKEEIDKLPDTIATLEGVVTFTYKAVPSDPKEIAKQVGNSSGLPPGIDIDQVSKQYAPMIQGMLTKHLATAGTLEAHRAIKVRSKTIPVGKHRFGFTFKGQMIAAIIVRIEGKKKPIKIDLKSKRSGLQDALKISCEFDKDKDDQFHVLVGFMRGVSKTRRVLKAPGEG